MNAYRRSWGWLVIDGESPTTPRDAGPYIEQDETSSLVFDEIGHAGEGAVFPHNWMILEIAT